MWVPCVAINPREAALTLSGAERRGRRSQHQRDDRERDRRAGVYVLLSKRYRDTQEGVPHFAHLRSGGGGVIGATRRHTRFLCRHPAPLGALPSGALDDAKANLQDFTFVGLQERFDESVTLLQRTLGLGVVLYENRCVDSDRPAVEDIPEEQRALIAECNRLDAELYRFAQVLFEDAVAAADQGLAAEAETLRDLSAAANQAKAREACDWLDVELPVGSTKRAPALWAAAEEAGISVHALRLASRLLAVKMDRDDDGQIWTRARQAREGDVEQRG
jgi:uncharacterized protein YukE